MDTPKTVSAVLAGTGSYAVVQGDARRLPWPDGVAHACVSSPPYWALRSYRTEDMKYAEIGCEETPGEYIARIVEVYREVRRVLREDGVAWLDLGDGYAGNGGAGGVMGKFAVRPEVEDPAIYGKWNRDFAVANGNALLMPHRVALALQADGWVVRMDVVWAKQNVMPESVAGWRWERCRVKEATSGQTFDNSGSEHEGGRRVPDASGGVVNSPRVKWAPCPGCEKCSANDGLVLHRGSWRPTKAHEYVFMLTKGDYFADGEDVRETASENTHSRGKGIGEKPTAFGQGVRNNTDFMSAIHGVVASRNLRSVWPLTTTPAGWDFCLRCSTFYVGAMRKTLRKVTVDGKRVKVCTRCKAPGEWVDHYAIMPTVLAERCLRTGPTKVCSACGAPWARVVERVGGPPPGDHRSRDDFHSTTYGNGAHPTGMLTGGSLSAVYAKYGYPERATLGFRPTCTCNAEASPPLVIDPFNGAGTTGVAALKLGWRYLGVDLSAPYVALTHARLAAPESDWAREQAALDVRGQMGLALDAPAAEPVRAANDVETTAAPREECRRKPEQGMLF